MRISVAKEEMRELLMSEKLMNFFLRYKFLNYIFLNIFINTLFFLFFNKTHSFDERFFGIDSYLFFSHYHLNFFFHHSTPIKIKDRKFLDHIVCVESIRKKMLNIAKMKVMITGKSSIHSISKIEIDVFHDMID